VPEGAKALLVKSKKEKRTEPPDVKGREARWKMRGLEASVKGSPLENVEKTPSAPEDGRPGKCPERRV